MEDMNGHEFEAEVRSVARALWPERPGAGAATIVDGRERDCIFESEFVTHYMECTTSRKLKKVKKDANKLTTYKKKRAGRTVKLWIVALNEPTPDQKSHCVQNAIEILSLKQFRRRLIDADQYLRLRENHSFGSATDPAKENSVDVSDIKYQPVGIRNTEDSTRLSIEDVSEHLKKDKRVLLLGDYGMGKSLNIK
jgi:DNA replication protein DnaC